MRWSAALFSMVAIACGPNLRDPKAADPDDAIFWFDGKVGEATVWIDGRYVGTLGSLKAGIAVEPGWHRAEIRHDHYFSRYLELDAKARERRRVPVELAPVIR